MPATSTARSVIGRAVHIKVHPRPRNIAESREILRVLERYGEVVMYKNLKYEPQTPAPNSLLAIYKHEIEAQKLLKASPIKFRSTRKSSDVEASRPSILNTNKEGQQKSAADGDRGQQEEESRPTASYWKPLQSFEAAGDGATTTVAPSPRSASGSDVNIRTTREGSIMSSTTPPTFERARYEQQEVQLYISPSAMNHQAYIERQGYYGRFNIVNRSVMAEDLEPRVPLVGLVELQVNKEEVPLRIRRKRAESGSTATLPRLRDLWEEGKRKQEEESRSHTTLEISS